MGNETQKGKNGEVVVNINHPRFANARIISEGGRRQLQTTVGVDQKEHERWSNTLKKARIDSPFLLVPRDHDFSRKGLCGDSGTLKLNYDNYSYLLTEQIENRSGRKSKFEEWELWSLLLGLSSAQQEMKRKTDGKIGDVRPHNVFVNAEGQMKVSCLLSWPRETTNFSKTFDNEQTYLAPEEMVRIEMGNMEDTSSFNAQVFSIGLTVLSAAMLDDFLRLYNVKQYHFDSNEATALLNEWRSNTVYSEIFTAIVSNLCQFQPEKRLTDVQLWEWISKYEREILNKDDFVIEEAPAKVELEMEEIRHLFPQDQVYMGPPETYTHGHETYLPPGVQAHPHPPHPFADKSVVESYIPPGQHYLPARHDSMFEGKEQVTRTQHGVPFPPGQHPQFAPTAHSQYQVVQGEVPAQVRRMSATQQQQPPSPQAVRRTVADPMQPQGQYRVLAEHELPPEIRKQIEERMSQGGNPMQPIQGGIVTRPATTGQTQMAPQFVGRTVNETYLNPSELPPGFNPQSQPQPQTQVIGQPLSPRQSPNVQYFQNVVAPAGSKGRIEETIYIQKPSEYETQ